MRKLGGFLDRLYCQHRSCTAVALFEAKGRQLKGHQVELTKLENSLDPEITKEFQQAQERSHNRLTAFMSVLPKELDARDDAVADILRHENASAKSKLRKIYTLMSEVSQHLGPYVACGKGCSGCCKMNISISVIEAERLSAASGKQMASVKQPTRHSIDEFTGSPCPFLVEDSCSVYEARPYACRAHFSFDTSAYWCQPERMHTGELSILAMGGVRKAYYEVVVNSRLHGFADIRDFFPD